MDLFGGPAMLGGILICVAQAAWMLGRWQGGAALAEDGRNPAPLPTAEPTALPRCTDGHPAPIAARPCQRAAQAERRGALEAVASLGDLHAEVSAYRRTEQVLTSVAREQLDLVLVPARAARECRYLGAGGLPTCPVPFAVRHGADCVSGCAARDPAPQRPAQPSPAASDFTRV